MLFVAWLYRQVFACCRRIDRFLFSQPHTDQRGVAVTDLPWLWVGGVNPDGSVIDYTEDINTTITYGTAVTPEWLDYVLDAKNVQWKYLDPKTLEEKDFPSLGFVIENDTAPEPSEEPCDE